MVSLAAFVVAARVVVMPVGDDAVVRAAAEAVRDAVVSVGHEVVDDEGTTSALGLVDDAACARGEVRCLTRLAVVAEARAAIVVLVATGPRREAVVVSAAGERRRVQTVPAMLTSAVARALVPPSTAQLRLSVSSSSSSSSSTSSSHVTIDGGPSVQLPARDGVAVAVAPGEHRLVVTSTGTLEQVLVVQIEAGESLWLDVVAHAAARSPDRTRTVVAFVAGGALGVAAAVTSAVLLTTARERIADADAATFQSERVAAARDANLAIGGAVVSAVLGLAGMGAAIVWGWP